MRQGRAIGGRRVTGAWPSPFMRPSGGRSKGRLIVQRPTFGSDGLLARAQPDYAALRTNPLRKIGPASQPSSSAGHTSPDLCRTQIRHETFQHGAGRPCLKSGARGLGI